jgi:predicted house-cleaning noncanonical NTP pyrophosphatase (MazG superfamily)
VRDKIPGIIRDAGSDCRVHSVRESELTYYLAKKMQEEITEFIKDPSVEEAADIYEVFLTLLRTWNIDMPDVIFKAEDKRQSRGGFTQGIILDEVSKN